MTVLDQVPVPGLSPYEGRAYFAARAQTQFADHDLDNIHVQFLDPTQSLVGFATGCKTVVETEETVTLTVTRFGNLTQAVTAHYTTTAVTASDGLDYLGQTGTLAFASGEITQTLTLTLLDDADTEGTESFQVALTGLTGNGAIGGPEVLHLQLVDDETQASQGYWSAPLPLPVIPIHASLLPTGDLMFWDRGDFGYSFDRQPRLLDLASGQVRPTAPIYYELFCAGHAFLEDGRLFIAGGHIADSTGEPHASIYDPFLDLWEFLPDMNAGRWYPSAVTLANGDVLVDAGYDTPGMVARIPQVWETGTSQWRNLTTAEHGGDPEYAHFYPFLFQAPNTQVFVAGPQQTARYLNPAGTGTWVDVASSGFAFRQYGSAVMYGEGQVLIVGGHVPNLFVSTATTEVIDLNAPPPPGAVWLTWLCRAVSMWPPCSRMAPSW
ncbi:MAG: hypothetical protein HC806_01560 [Anaerolineae bacterium]|nr:hypothetical protein [Anaerolineae bacterium]